MIEQEKINDALINWDIENVLSILNDAELNPQDFLVPGKTDVLNEFIARKYGAFVNIIIGDEYDYLKNGFNYLDTAISVVNRKNKNFDICKKLIKVIPSSEFTRTNSVTGSSPWLKCFENGFLTPVEKMNARGVDWSVTNHLGQNAAILYVRNNQVSDMFLKFLIANKSKIDINQKDLFGVSLKDVLLSASFCEDWINKANNKMLLEGLVL